MRAADRLLSELLRRLRPEPSRSFAGFLRAVQRGDVRALEKSYGSCYTAFQPTVAKAAMGLTSGAGGGYTVPPEMRLELLEAMSEESFILARAHSVPMQSARVMLPRVDVETVQPAGVSPAFGGVVFKWGLEQAPAETEPSFRQLELRAYDLLGYLALSHQFLEDAGEEASEYLIKLLGKAAGWYAEYAFLRGTGDAQLMPLGVVNAPAALNVNRAVGNQIASADVANMVAGLLPHSYRTSVWACSPTCMAQLDKMASFFLSGGGKEDERLSGFLANRPLFVTEILPPLGTRGDLVLFDPQLYAVGRRMDTAVDVSEHALFRTNQVVFRVWLRMDGRPVVSNKVTLQDGTTVVSPYVVLN